MGGGRAVAPSVGAPAGGDYARAMAGGYRVAPERVVERIVCGPLVAWRGVVVGALALALAAWLQLSLGWTVGGIGAGLVALFFLIVSTQRSVLLELDPQRRQLVVTSHRGSRRLREELDLRRAVSVGLVHARSTHGLDWIPGRALVETCIVVEMDDGTRHPLFHRRFGAGAQARAAAKLSALLRLGRLPEPTRPRRELAWATPFVVVGAPIVVGMVGVIVLGARMERDEGLGRLELRCRGLCRLGGLTCLPGGLVQQPAPPGELVVEVADPSAEGGYRAVTVPIRTGQLTVFECHPDAVSPEPPSDLPSP